MSKKSDLKKRKSISKNNDEKTDIISGSCSSKDKNIAKLVPVNSEESLQSLLVRVSNLVPENKLTLTNPKDRLDQQLLDILCETSPKDLEVANYRWEQIEPFINRGEAITSELPQRINSEAPQRTIRHWVQNYFNAEAQYGCGFLGLLPTRVAKGTCDKNELKESMKLLDNCLDRKLISGSNDSDIVIYQEYTDECSKHKVVALSYKTFNRAIGQRRRINSETLKIKPNYDFSVLYKRPFETACIDNTQIDASCLSKSGEQVRPWLTLMVDEYTREVLGAHVDFNTPSHLSDMMVIKDCLKRNNVVPDRIIVEEFKSNREYQTFLAEHGITHIKRPPYKVGNIVESIFAKANKILDYDQYNIEFKNANLEEFMDLDLIEEQLNSYLCGQEKNTQTKSNLNQNPEEKGCTGYKE